MRIGESTHEATAGDTIVVPPHTRFAIANESDEPLEAICCQPVGGQAMLDDGQLFTPPWAASKLVDAMEAAGYVRRHADAHDARAKLVSTARGRRLLAAVEAIYAELEAEWAAVLGAGRLEQLRGDLERAIGASHDGELPPVRPAR